MPFACQFLAWPSSMLNAKLGTGSRVDPLKNRNQADFLTSYGKFVASRPDGEWSAESARASTENTAGASRESRGRGGLRMWVSMEQLTKQSGQWDNDRE